MAMVKEGRECNGCEAKSMCSGDGDKEDGKELAEVKSTYRGDGGKATGGR